MFLPDADTPAGQVAEREFQAAYENLEAVEQFEKSVDVITLDFENIPVVALAAGNKYVYTQAIKHSRSRETDG